VRIPDDADQHSGLIAITVPGQNDQRSCVMPIIDRQAQERKNLKDGLFNLQRDRQ
jgi:hypothetical protein